MYTNWVVTRFFGEKSEPWLYRQVVGQSQLKPSVVCWEHRNPNEYPLDDINMNIVPFDPFPEDRSGRWFRRLRSSVDGNYYASRGKERVFLSRLLDKHQPSVILCHFGHIALRVLPVAESRGIPVVAHFHGLDLSSGLGNRWYRWSLLRHLKRFAAVVVVGSHQREWMINNGVEPHRVHLIPCGVPTKEFDPKERNVNARVRFVSVSRLVEGKGLPYTIAALDMVRQAGVDAELVIVGDGPDKQLLEALIEKHALGRYVTFQGALPPADVKGELWKADVFVQHSIVDSRGWSEGFGVSISEAMSMELPVVTTAVGGIVDQVRDGETGLLVPPGDVKEMAQAMATLAMSADERSRMGKNGRRHMIEHFDNELQIGRLENVLIEVIKDGDRTVGRALEG